MGYILKAKPRDSQRKRLYAAEGEVKAFLRDPLPTIGEMQAFVDSILRSRWLQIYLPARVLAPITVLGGRRQRQATAMSFLSTIAMPKRSRSKFIVIHEVAHILADRYYGEDLIAGHGPEFATFQLALVSYFLGAEDGIDLLEAFGWNGVTHSYRGGELP